MRAMIAATANENAINSLGLDDLTAQIVAYV
jgi:hypothetical protein